MKRGAAAYNVASVLQPTVILPSQFWDFSRGRHFPELRLMAAVLENAIECLTRGNGGGTRGKHWRAFLDACDWVANERRDWPFAFANLCDFLGLDPTAVRESLEPLIAAQHSHLDLAARS